MSAQQSYPNLFCVACSTNLVFIKIDPNKWQPYFLSRYSDSIFHQTSFTCSAKTTIPTGQTKNIQALGLSMYLVWVLQTNQCQNNYFQTVLVRGVAPAWYMTCKDPIKPRFHPPRTSLKVHNLLWYFNEVKNVKFSICFIWKSKDKKLWSASNLPEFAPAGHIIVLPDATISNVSSPPSLPSLLTTNLFWNILQLA